MLAVLLTRFRSIYSSTSVFTSVKGDKRPACFRDVVSLKEMLKECVFAVNSSPLPRVSDTSRKVLVC